MLFKMLLSFTWGITCSSGIISVSQRHPLAFVFSLIALTIVGWKLADERKRI
jgi:hypothetical protein